MARCPLAACQAASGRTPPLSQTVILPRLARRPPPGLPRQQNPRPTRKGRLLSSAAAAAAAVWKEAFMRFNSAGGLCDMTKLRARDHSSLSIDS